METVFNIAASLIDPILLAVTVIYVYGFVARVSTDKSVRNLMMGVTFGFGAMFAMMAPIVFAEGIIIDMRNLLVGLSSAFFGLIGAAFTISIAVITRIMIGGGGAIAGVLGILIAGIAGLVWARYIRGHYSSISKEGAFLGLMISAHLASIFLLPTELAWRLWVEIAPILIAFNLIGAILIGGLLTREEKLMAENEALANAATTDPLTRLHNRRSAVKAYEALPDTNGDAHGTAMMCIDVDNFKSVNDTFGHIFGDAVLSEITVRIGRVLRPTDIFSRLGGDEFLIILPAVTLEETTAIAQRCRTAVAQDVIVHEDQLAPVTISIGAEWLPDQPDFVTFVARADEALYQAKRLGRNCVSLAWQNARLTSHFLNGKCHQKSA